MSLKQEEFRLADEACSALLAAAGCADWAALLRPFPFFTSFKNYLQVGFVLDYPYDACREVQASSCTVMGCPHSPANACSEVEACSGLVFKTFDTRAKLCCHTMSRTAWLPVPRSSRRC